MDNYAERLNDNMDNTGLALPSIFSDHMVLQQQEEILIWGTCRENDNITITFLDCKYQAEVYNNIWQVQIEPLPAGGPYDMTIEAKKDRIVLKDILIGEIWVCGGQSNMAFTLTNSLDGNIEIKNSYNPQIRLFSQTAAGNKEPAYDVIGGIWNECTPGNAGGFSAVAYFFGRELQKRLNAPVGLIVAAVGASQIQDWMSIETLHSDEQYLSTYVEDKRSFVKPSHLYNQMLAPFFNYAIKGAIFYQGESNANRGEPAIYSAMLKDMICNWRKGWRQSDFPFLFVQLAAFNAPKSENWALVREAQLNVYLNYPNTYMISAVDLGEQNNIHPLNKKEVGRRLSLAARASVYNEDIEYSGPIVKNAKFEEGKIIIKFDHADRGLLLKDDHANGFKISGEDGKFIDAQIEITGKDALTVWSDKINNPVEIRYAWEGYPVVSLFNNDRLPASPFRLKALV